VQSEPSEHHEPENGIDERTPRDMEEHENDPADDQGYESPERGAGDPSQIASGGVTGRTKCSDKEGGRRSCFPDRLCARAGKRGDCGGDCQSDQQSECQEEPDCETL